MNIYDGGYVYENTHNEYIMQVEREIYLGSMLSIDYNILVKYFKSTSIIPVFRFFVLNDDETVDYDISHDVVSANINISYQSGQRRSMNITLANPNNHWIYGTHKTLWHGMLFRVDCGAVIDKTLYWQQQGVFVLKEPNISASSSKKSISLSLVDKWGLWDGSIYGNTQFKTIIPTGVPMRQVYDAVLHEDDGTGRMWDCKPCLFNNEYWNTNTY